jgi:hypothetical protein
MARIQIFKGPKAKPYHRAKGLSGYDPRLRDNLIVINPKTKKEYIVRGLVIVDSGASGLSLDAKQYERMVGAIGPLKEMVRVSMTAGGPVISPFVKEAAYCVKKSCVKGTVGSNRSGVTLLGMDFLETAGCSADFKKRTMTCGTDQFKIGPKKFILFGKR